MVKPSDPRTPMLSASLSHPTLSTDIWALFDSLPVPAAAYDLRGEGRMQFLNAAFSASFGYTIEDIPDLETWAQIAYPDPHYRTKVFAEWEAQIVLRRSGGDALPPSEYRLRDKAGRDRLVLIGFALHGPFVLVTLQDLTDLRATEAALVDERRRSEQTAYALTENMPGGAYTMVLKPGAEMAQFSFLSERFLEMLDLDREAVLADPMAGFACVHPADRPQWVAWNAEAFMRREAFSHEARVVARGQTRWIRAESVPRELPDGSIIWEGILVDITRLKATEAQLNEVLRAARAYTWRRDLVAGRSEFDEAWAEFEDHPQHVPAVPGATWLNTVHPDDVADVSARVSALERGEVAKDILTYRRKIQGDRWIWLQVHAGVSARDEAGRPTALSGISFDVTEAMQAKLQAQEVEAELRENLQRAHQRDTVAQVAAGIAHELNNRLSLILWTLERLSPLCADDPELRDGCVQIHQSVGRASELTAGLGELMRPNMPRAQHDLADLLQAALNLLGARRVAQHDVRVELPGEAVSVWGNSTEILQVVTNLLVNACEASTPDRPARVWLKAHPRGAPAPQRGPDSGRPTAPGVPVALFEITDTGSGIEAAVKAQMFDRNYSTKGSAGTGLGLPIVARILHDNGAALWVDTRVGEGTTFTIAWPCQPGVPAASGPQTGHQVADGSPFQLIDPTALTRVQALVVDDLLDVAEVLTSMLETAGADAYAVTDPLLAMEALSETPEQWSVLITDLHMPGHDGQELAQFAAGLSPPVPVVLVTARPDAIDDDGKDVFAAILSKPVSGAHLVETVLDVVATRRGS